MLVITLLHCGSERSHGADVTVRWHRPHHHPGLFDGAPGKPAVRDWL